MDARLLYVHIFALFSTSNLSGQSPPVIRSLFFVHFLGSLILSRFDLDHSPSLARSSMLTIPFQSRTFCLHRKLEVGDNEERLERYLEV